MIETRFSTEHYKRSQKNVISQNALKMYDVRTIQNPSQYCTMIISIRFVSVRSIRSELV